MKRDEYNRRRDAFYKARDEMFAFLKEACPSQREKLSEDVTLSWQTDREEACGYKTHVYCDSIAADHPFTMVLRIAEIQRALEAWSRNEADWPLAKEEKC